MSKGGTWKRNPSQKLYSKPLLNGRPPHPTSKELPSHPVENANLGCLYPQSRSFGYDRDFITIAEGRNVDQLLNRELWLNIASSALYQQTNRSVHRSPSPFSTWGRNPPPTWRGQPTFFWSGTITLQTTPVHAISLAGREPAETRHPQKGGTKSTGPLILFGSWGHLENWSIKAMNRTGERG